MAERMKLIVTTTEQQLKDAKIVDGIARISAEAEFPAEYEKRNRKLKQLLDAAEVRANDAEQALKEVLRERVNDNLESDIEHAKKYAKLIGQLNYEVSMWKAKFFNLLGER